MKFGWKEDGKRVCIVCLAALLMALNIKTFVQTGGLYPGGATGLTILIQRSAKMFFCLLYTSKGEHVHEHNVKSVLKTNN